MKTLYISDLDGTLLNKNAELSSYTVNTLNSLINQGIHFTIATARTIASVSTIMAQVHLNLPLVLMNGVLIYDIASKKYQNIQYLSTKSIHRILTIMKENNITGFMYEVNNDKLATYYERLETKALNEFHDERVERYQKPFNQVSDFADVIPDHIIYFALMDKKGRLEPVYQALQDIPGIATAFYLDIYSNENIWYLEIFSSEATKYNAAMYIRETYGYDCVIGFGDNVNDLPLFQACDITCAVSNAREDVKKVANHIIDSNVSDGVPRWIKDYAIYKGVMNGEII